MYWYKKIKKLFVVSLVTLTNTSKDPPFICAQYISYSSLTIPLVQLTKHIHIFPLFFCDPG